MIERIETSGTFQLDGGTWEVTNNVWLVGDGDEVLVVDPAHDARVILDAVGDRTVTGLVCTHGHNDHIDAAAEVADKTGAPIMIHPDDQPLWTAVYPDREPDVWLADGRTVGVAGTKLEVLTTPGHTWGAISLYARDFGAIFTGDTLFAGGPGATGRSYSYFPAIISSIRERLLTLPPETIVHTGHGQDTTIGAEAPHVDEWIRRGH